MKILILCMAIIISMIIVSPHPLYNESLGSSPAFVHQEIFDRNNDWLTITQPSSYTWKEPNGTVKKIMTETNKQECIEQKGLALPPNIGAVTYLSDGISLNGTIWLTSPLKKLPFHNMGYTISVDFYSIYDTGTDYYVKFSKNPYDLNWTRTIEETSSSTDQKLAIDISDYTDFVNYDQTYFPFSFKLSHLNFPNQYKIIFTAWDQFLNKNNKLCYLVDLGTWVQIPPPRYSITTLPSTIVLRPGEEAEIEVSLTSVANVESAVSLHTSRIKGLNVSFIPDRLYLGANETSTSIMKIGVSDDAEKRQTTIPIYVTIGFPTGGRIANTSTIVTNDVSKNTTINSKYSIEILPPLEPADYLKILAEQWAEPLDKIYAFIGTLITGIIAVVSALFIRKKRGSRK
jgi:hypothetical protein